MSKHISLSSPGYHIIIRLCCFKYCRSIGLNFSGQYACRSQLFRLYVSEIESRFQQESFAIRCCKDGKEHIDLGEVAERIWCLYIFHVRGSHIMNETTSS